MLEEQLLHHLEKLAENRRANPMPGLAGLRSEPDTPEAAAARVAQNPPKIAPHGTFLTATTSKIRLGFLSPNLNSGGAESVQLQLLKGLDQTKFQFVGMVCGDPMSATDATMTAATSAYIPIQYGLATIATLAANCDVVISWMIEDMHQWMGGATTPFIYIDHFPHSAPLNSIAQYCLQGAAAVVGVSSLCSPAWTGPTWASKYSAIPNAVDTTRLAITQTANQMKASWGIKPNALGVYPPVAGSYCRVHADRRPDAVIRAVTALPSVWHVVVIGEQNNVSELTYLNNLIAGLTADQQSRVHLLPENPSSGNVLSTFNVVVSAASGITESFGLTMAEALSLGRPVVATPFGMAQMYPSMFYPVQLDDTAPNLATAIQAAYAGGVKIGAQTLVQQTFSQANFVNAWTTLIQSVATKKVSSMPGLGTMAASFAKSVISHAAHGFPLATPEVQAERKRICQACPRYLAESDRCSLCGCYLSAKRTMGAERCPEGKW